MKSTCPECKNQLDLTKYPEVSTGNVIECNVCGITLRVTAIDEGEVFTDIVDEGK